jgi:hypothetical protein
MREEKRQTRLLPFRLRRAGARRYEAADFADDVSADAELTALLREWDAPEISSRSRERLLADFRAGVAPAPLWRRVLGAQLRVPLPVAACAVTSDAQAKAGVSEAANAGESRTVADAAKSAEAAPALKAVEVPVEKVVTRVVYVEKKERGETGQAFARADASRVPTVKAVWPKVGAHDDGARPEESKGAGATTSYFTRVDMNDFQPADEVKIRIVKRGRADEK